MKYVEIIFLIIISIYPFSYVGYNWSKKNKFGAIGVLLLSTAAIIFPSVLILFK